MKKILLVIVAFLMVATFAFAASQKGKVVSVDGDKVTIELKGNDLKAGDNVQIDSDSGAKKTKKPAMKGC